MRICIPIIALMLVFSSGQVFSQQTELSKEEIKHWKNVAKDYRKNPVALMELTEERDRLRNDQGQVQDRINSLESQLRSEKARIAELEQENTRLNNSLAMTEQSLMQLQNQQAAAPQMPDPPMGNTSGIAAGTMPSGTVFMIQVGAFKKGAVPQKFYQYNDLFVEDAGATEKVLIGQYRGYDDAKARQAQLKREGYTTAWIVSFIDGQRVPLKDALR